MTVLPSAVGLAANRSRHRRSLITTERGPATVSSSGENSRPSAKFTLTVLKKFEEISLPLTCSGKPGLVRSKPCCLNAAIRSNERELCCQSMKSGYERLIGDFNVRL